MKKLIIVALVLVGLAGCGQKEGAQIPAPAEETRRQTAAGAVIGFVAENGAHVWRGVPYAASTAGENRWRAPRPAPAWEGAREAVRFAERCAQLTNAFDRSEGLKPNQLIGSEDCLALDIYAPAEAEGEALPVMVWIHGGGNVWGRSSSYDGSNLAVNENVIVVAVQYRLGPLGWFAHRLLRDSAETQRDASANFGTLDLVASLEWVRENISAFGGDPSRVTVFGESAGGHNVATLLASPLAEGLFHRAIIQSGSFDSVSLAVAEGLEGDHANNSASIVEALAVADAAALRAVPLEELFDVLEKPNGFLDTPRIIEDGVALPSTPMFNALRSTDTFNAVPVITGTNRDEMKLFYMLDPRMTKRILGVFIVARDQDFYDAASDYASRFWRSKAVNAPASLVSGIAGHEPVYAYRFDWDEGGRFLWMDLSKVLGAAHALEIPFVFNRYELLGSADATLFKKNTLESRETLSRMMGAYWASFARDGVPSAAGGPDWPVYGPERNGAWLRFDSLNDGGVEAMGAGSEDNAVSVILDDLKSDPRLDPEERCRVAELVKEWEPLLVEIIDAQTACG